MAVNLNNIEKICDSIGGISIIQITDDSNINPDNTIIDPAKVYTIHFRRNTASYNSKTQNSDQNRKIKQRIKAFVPKIRLSMETLIKNIIDKRLTVIYTDRESNTGILRSAEFDFEYNTGLKMADKQGYKIEFNTEKLYSSLDYSGVNIDLPDPGDPWDGTDPGTVVDECCVLINPVQVGYIPTPTGNANNRNEYVIGSNGVRYFIDKTGASLPFPFFPQYFESFTGITADRVTVTVATLPTTDINKQIRVLRNGVEQTYTSGTPGDGEFTISGSDIIFNRALESWEKIKVYFSANT